VASQLLVKRRLREGNVTCGIRPRGIRCKRGGQPVLGKRRGWGGLPATDDDGTPASSRRNVNWEGSMQKSGNDWWRFIYNSTE